MFRIVRKNLRSALRGCCFFSITLVSSLVNAATSIEMGGTAYVVNFEPSGSLITTQSGQIANLSSDDVTRLINAAVLASDVSAYVRDLGSERATTALLNTVGEMDTIAEVQLARSGGNALSGALMLDGIGALIGVATDIGAASLDAKAIGAIVEDGIQNLASLQDFEDPLRSTGAVLLTGNTISIEELESVRTTLESAQMHEQIIMAQTAAAYGYMNKVGLVTAIPNTLTSENSFFNTAGLLGMQEEDAKQVFDALQAVQVNTGSIAYVTLADFKESFSPQTGRLVDEFTASLIPYLSIAGYVETIYNSATIYDGKALNPDFVNQIYDQAEETVLADRVVRESLSVEFIQYQLDWQRVSELQALKTVEQEKVITLTEQASEEQQQASREQDEAEAQATILDRHLSSMHKDLRYLANETEDLIEKISDVSMDYTSVLQLRKALDYNIDDWESRRNQLSRESSLLKQVVDEFEDHSYVKEWTINGRTFRRSELQTYKTMLAEQLLILNYAEKIVGEKGDRTADDRYPAYLALAKLENTEDSLKAAFDAESAALLTQSNLDAYNAEIADLQISLQSFEQENTELSFAFVEQTQFSTEESCLLIEGCSGSQEGIDDNQKESLQNENISANTNTNTNTNTNLYSVPLLVGQFRSLPLIANSERVSPLALLNAILGDGYTIADWNDISAAYLSDPAEFTLQYRSGAGTEKDPVSLYEPEIPGSTNTRWAGQITKNGSWSAGRITYSGKTFERQYYLNFHDGQTPSYYGVYGQVGGNEFVAGSWVSNNSFMAKKIGADPEYSFDKNARPASQEAWSGLGINWDGGSVSQIPVNLTLNPTANRIESIEINSDTKPIYRPDSIERATYYLGKNYFGVSWGDLSTWWDPTKEFGWVVTTPDPDLANYDYTSWGEWQTETSYNPTTGASTFTEEGAQWIAGQLTPGGNIPTSASATYSGKVLGLVNNGTTIGVAGNANLTANFGTRTLTGSFNNMKLDNNANWKTLNVNASWGAGVNSISGTVNGGGATGTVNGHFFGPNAEEMGGSWQTAAGAEKAAGIFRAKQ